MKKKSKIKVSSAYAKAWYDGALKQEELDKTFEDSRKLGEFLSPADVQNLANPILPQQLKTQIIGEVSERLGLTKSTSELLLILSENKRFSNIENVLKDFNSLYYKGKNIAEVLVQSVKSLSESQKAKLKQNLEKFLNKSVYMKYELNPSIIGGLKVSFDTYQIDDSIHGKLNNLEYVMKGDE